jgi:hypothetical protein
VKAQAAEFFRITTVAKVTIMRKLISMTLAGVMLAGLSIAMVGCTEEAGVTRETEIKGPGGATKVIDKTTVEKTGKNPPAVSVETKP